MDKIGILILVAGLFIYVHREVKHKDKIISGLILGAAVVVSVCLIFLSAIIGGSTSSKSKTSWDSLPDEKKQWYEENFGDGKMEAYNKAIDDYKSSH